MLDMSAVPAALWGEQGFEQAAPHLPRGDHERREPGRTPLEALCAELRCKTRAARLSLPDRACIAVGLVQGRTVMTADRAWMTLGLSQPVGSIR
jgi:hypothetical protein